MSGGHPDRAALYAQGAQLRDLGERICNLTVGAPPVRDVIHFRRAEELINRARALLGPGGEDGA